MNDDVRYSSSGFEYFLSRFAGSLAPMAPTLVPSRARRDLSGARISYVNDDENNKWLYTLTNRSILMNSVIYSQYGVDLI